MTRLEHAFKDEINEDTPFDRLLRAEVGRYTGGISPVALALAFTDWSMHLGLSPNRQAELIRKGVRKSLRLAAYFGHCVSGEGSQRCIDPLPQDHRFDAPEWQQWPFSMLHQAFLLQQQWWHVATTGVSGVNPHHEEVVNFMVRQWLDMFSPSNFLPTNPEVLKATVDSAGWNLWRGATNAIQDTQRYLGQTDSPENEHFTVGRDLAATPGQVIYRNALMELIQYSPTTKTVYPEPVLIVPAWIMKYYILDLRPGRSLIEYLVNQGHTVFVVSWKNPGPEERDHGMDDYRRLGVMDAIKIVNTVVPKQKVHAVGYCLGGTLLSLAAAAMARDDDDRFATMTLLAAQTDFTDPGELDLFIDHAQVAFLEDVMWARGYLSRDQMAAAFQLLRSQDLVWSRMVRHYLLGEREELFDLMAWNMDSTRLPYRMHSEYLRELFLENDLVEARYDIDGRPVALGDINVPIFTVATKKDHIAPWESVYKIIRHARTPVTFLLTEGGHNAGIVTHPRHPHRTYQMRDFQPNDKSESPEAFLRNQDTHNGSWWLPWQAWLANHSGARVRPPAMGAPDAGHPPITAAPGEYVLER